MRKFKYIQIALLCCLLYPLNICAASTKIFHLSKTTNAQNPLLMPAKTNSSVEVIPYYVSKGKIYILLGQELTGGKLEHSGAFGSFGDQLQSGNAIMPQVLDAFHKETLGQFRLDTDYILKNGHLLYTQNENDQLRYCIFLRFNHKLYAKSNKFTVAHVRLKASSPPNSHFHKENFVWVRLDDLIQNVTPKTTESTAKDINSLTTEKDSSVSNCKIVVDMTHNITQRYLVHTPQGQSINILLRKDFLQECLQNPSLPILAKQLAK